MTDLLEKNAPVNYSGRGLAYESEESNRNIYPALSPAERRAADPTTPDDPDLLPGSAGLTAPDPDDDNKPGQGYLWDAAIGPGKKLDTTRYFVICADALGAGQTTGPASPDPETGRRYGVRFPVITVRDMVRAQHRLVQRLGIDRLHAVKPRLPVLAEEEPAVDPDVVGGHLVLGEVPGQDESQHRHGQHHGTATQQPGRAAVEPLLENWLALQGPLKKVPAKEEGDGSQGNPAADER